MGSPTVTMKCPSCGQELRAVLAPFPPTQWFPCPNCHVPVPVVVPRDLPPLYSWEVIPGLYPQLPPLRRPRWRPATVGSITLAVVAALAAICAGITAYEGYVAAQPAEYVVSGTVYEELRGGGSIPMAGAHVALFSDGNKTFGNATTTANGTFRFTGVPAGGIMLNVTAANYAPTVVYTFACRSYSTQTRGLDVTLVRGGPNNTSFNALSPFSNMENLLSVVGGASVLFTGAAAVAAVAAWTFRRPKGAVSGVLGAGAGVAVPTIVVFLSLGNVFSIVTVVAAVVGGAGAFALVLATIEVATRTEPAPPG